MASVRLKSLKIFGFKSFAEEVEIQFPKRFTVIVGPNGSGKSNIVDALRWGLGDQSYRLLRISEAVDLIYQSERKKINFAKVTLVLSLSEEEVELERKINRRGEISYWKNGQEVRLKDIVEFLAKLKIGVKGFTVINQGMSDLFLRASPKERYDMLSEMFGTKFLELKKKEAISNLESAQERYQALERELAKIKPVLELYQKEKEKLAKKQLLTEKLNKLMLECQQIEKFKFQQKEKELLQEIKLLEKKIEELTREIKEMSKFSLVFPEERLNELQKRKIALLEKKAQLSKRAPEKSKTDLLPKLKEGLLEILQLKTVAEIHQKVKALLALFTEKEEPAVDPKLDLELQEISRKIAEEEARLQEKRNIYQAKMKEISQKERELARYQYEKQSKEKILAEIENALQNLKSVSPKEGNLESVKKELEKTKEEIWQIGSIHEGILQQGEEAKKKYESVSQELEDVARSLQELKEKIEHYGKEIKTTFKMYLDRINLDLENYFREFFGPGELRLIYQEEEIHLQFRHAVKNLRTLESLSGGERALVSIILIFALTQISEPPFLILDEIDAPLDENNARKFVELIKKLSYRTQFIVITHNRVTMENAEAIYGVTMDQEGVSKIFSLKLKQAEELIET